MVLSSPTPFPSPSRPWRQIWFWNCPFKLELNVYYRSPVSSRPQVNYPTPLVFTLVSVSSPVRGSPTLFDRGLDHISLAFPGSSFSCLLHFFPSLGRPGGGLVDGSERTTLVETVVFFPVVHRVDFLRELKVGDSLAPRGSSGVERVSSSVLGLQVWDWVLR